MKTSQLIYGIWFAASRTIDRILIQPHRNKAWAKRKLPFVHQNDVGLKFELHPHEYVDHHIFQHGFYERRFLDILANRFPKGAVALDIGANIGNHAIYLANSFAKN